MNQRNLFLAFTAIAVALFSGLYFHASPKPEDVEMNVTQEVIAPGCLKFEGTVINTSAKDISEVTITATITNLSFDDETLKGCGLESPITTVRNLKAGETRAVIWYFNHAEDQLRCGRQVYPDKASFTYRTYWGNFKWKLWVSKIK